MTKSISIGKLNLATNIRRWILLVVLGCTSAISAQGVLSGAQTGTLQEMRQADGYMTISGRDYGYDNDVTVIFYDGQQVRTQFLNEGLVLRFVVNRDGVLSRIEILGPIDLIEALEES